MTFKWNRRWVVKKAPQITTLSLKLEKRLASLGIRVIPKINRLYPGRNQRSAGAWSWFVRTRDNMTDVGSCWTVTQIVKAERLTASSKIGSIEIFPED